jgi:hypothetical protein
MLHRETEARNPLRIGVKGLKNALARYVLRHFVRSWEVFAHFPTTRTVALCLRIMPSYVPRRHTEILNQTVLAMHYSA